MFSITVAYRDRTRPCVKDIRTKRIARAIVDAQNNGEPTFLRCLSCEIGEGNKKLHLPNPFSSFFFFTLRATDFCNISPNIIFMI